MPLRARPSKVPEAVGTRQAGRQGSGKDQATKQASKEGEGANEKMERHQREIEKRGGAFPRTDAVINCVR